MGRVRDGGPHLWLSIFTGEREGDGQGDRNEGRLGLLVGERGMAHQEAGAEVSLGRKILPRKLPLCGPRRAFTQSPSLSGHWLHLQ